MMNMWFKNTAFVMIFTFLSCGNGKTQVNNTSKASENEKVKTTQSTTTRSPQRGLSVTVGANQFEEYLPLLKDKKVAIVGNQTSIVFKNSGYVHLVDTLLSKGVTITKVFAPEHGFRGQADAGEKVNDSKDTKTGLPIISLYGNNKKPSVEQLNNVDVIVFDIQDVGARFYTYISTLHYIMEACAEQGKPLIVLDRPNPNGHYADGPLLDQKHSSFVGMHPVPVVHGMTIGEYAQMISGEGWLDTPKRTDLTVIPVKNYNKSMPYSLPIKPSPNLPNSTAVNLYPTLCFFEGTNVNAGRGTNKQFQVFGSPYLNPEIYNFKYTPKANEGSKYPKHLGELCYGFDLSENNKRFTELHLEILISAYNNTANKAEFFNSFFTKLAGTTILQEQIESGLTAEEISETWQEGLKIYNQVRTAYELYKR
ncbi:exo-beta-N-acetylmuramidase NamZ family protein [Croceibacter atlanticus]|jgi:uncharacterized protein YbbC (DUF1343 family)|uniref:exo-beta-N-acetylmuramidase NamZ family protein n=1 Tax=Croceibacter atlanticus TaxID=313588 RepID=UPI003C6D06D1